MFGWFSSAACPIPDESRAWVEQRMAWIMDRFGPDRVRQARIILPTEEFFPDRYDSSEEAGERLFDRVCTYAGVERSRVQLRWITSDAANPQDRQRPLIVDRDGRTSGASGTYQGGNWSNAEIITLDRRNLPDPMHLVATAAHELCHCHLLGDGHILRDEEDHEPLTDLLTIGLGLGIFGANASFNDRGWGEARMSGWSVSKLGYLYQPTWGYALALFAWVRGEERPKWARHLRPDVRRVFKTSAAYLAKRGVKERGLME
jgi:hypothetical protein